MKKIFDIWAMDMQEVTEKLQDAKDSFELDGNTEKVKYIEGYMHGLTISVATMAQLIRKENNDV